MTPLRLSPATGWLHARWLQAGYTPLVRVRGRVGVRVRVRVRVRLRLRLRLRLRVSRLRAGWLEAADGHACEPLGFVGALVRVLELGLELTILRLEAPLLP